MVPATALVPVPDSLPLDVAAAMPEQWQTAFQLLFVVGGLPLEPAGEPETVLVYAAGSGVGTAVLQLLRMTGRHAIAVAGRADKLAMAESLGARLAVNYKDDEEWHGEPERAAARRCRRGADDSAGAPMTAALGATRPPPPPPASAQ